MKRFLVFFGILIVIASASYYLFIRKNNISPEGALVYNQATGGWDSISNPLRVDIEQVDEDPNDDGLHNRTILRGFFDHYDNKKDELVIKASLPFTAESQYQITNIKMTPQKIVFCSPSLIEDGVTGEYLKTIDMGYIVKNGEEMKIYKETTLNFEDFLKNATEQTYVFVQLTSNFNKDKTSYAQKIVVVGLCD